MSALAACGVLFAGPADDLYEEIRKAADVRVSSAGKTLEEQRKEAAKLLTDIIDKCEQYKKQFPDGAQIGEVYYEEGRACFFLSRYQEPRKELLEKGAEAARKAVEKDPKGPAAAKARGLLIQYFRTNGKPEQALEQAEIIAKDFAGTDFAPLALMYMGDIYEKLGKEKEALAAYEKLAKEYPDSSFGARAAGILAFRKLKGSVMDLSFTSTSGENIDLKNYRGKVVLVDFWASWCAPCEASVPMLVETEKLLRNLDFRVIGISLDDDKEAMDAFIKKANMSWPQYFDGKKWDNDIARKFGINVIPATVLIDRTGKVREIGLHGADLQAALRKLLNEKKP